MKTLHVALVAALLFPSASLAATPFDGAWYYVCLAPAEMETVRPMVIADDTILGEESACDITEVSPIGDRGESWKVTSSCAGEGERWTAHSLFALERDPSDGSRILQLVEIDMDEGWVQSYRTCK
jgi:hypothetical protein